ncbi:MAG: PAS domain-containing protein [Candidatus Thorarchaeota archaeon]
MEYSIEQGNEEKRIILDSIFDEIMILNRDFSIIDVNQTFCSRYNVKRDHIIGTKCYQVTHGINKICRSPQYKCPVEEVLKTGELNTSFHKHHVNEKEIYLEIRTYPIKNDRGDIEQIVKIGRDITEWKKSEIKLKNYDEMFRNLVENFPYSIILLDSNKQIYDCNTSFELYLNRNREDLKNFYFFDILQLTETQIDSFNEIFQNTIEFGLSDIMEFEIINNNEKESWIQAFFSTVEIGGNKFVQVMLQDITERILAEKIIREENRRLRDLDNMKKKMTTKASEQLKNPLNVLSNATDILLDTYREKLDYDIIKLLELIKSEGEKSLDLVGKIVNISKIESDQLILNRQTESLTDIILESVNSLNDKLESQKIKTNALLSEDLYSEVDKMRIKLVIKEIISYICRNSNSRDIVINIKKINDFGEIEIKGQLCQYNEKAVLQEVSFSKQIVDLHNGQILIESGKKEMYCTFKIHLPLKEWRDALLHLYVIYKSGIPLVDYAFNKLEGYSDSSLISGGIIGLMTILKAILKGETQIKSIDHGDRTIIFNVNYTEDVVFVLIVKENINIIERKLEALIKEFDANCRDLIKNIEKTCSDQDNWLDLIALIQKYFGEIE